MYAIPSSYASYYQLGYQYSAMILGAIYISAIMGTYNLIRLGKYAYNRNKSIKLKIHKIFRRKKDLENIEIIIASIIIILIVIISVPYGILAPPTAHQSPHRCSMNDIYNEVPDGSAAFLINLSNSLSPNSYILTENTLMPYFSNFFHIYASPYSPGYDSNISKFQYIIIQNNSFWAVQGGNHSLENIVNTALKNGEFKLIEEYKPGNIMVYKNTG